MKFILPFTLILLILSGCSGSSPGGGTNSIYSTNVGTGTKRDVYEKTMRFITKYNLELFRTDESSDMTRFETNWKDRNPLEDEAVLNVQEGRVRIFIQSTPRGMGQTGMTSDINVVRFIAENEVRLRDQLLWRPAQLTPMLREYLKRLSDDLSIELRTGIRTF